MVHSSSKIKNLVQLIWFFCCLMFFLTGCGTTGKTVVGSELVSSTVDKPGFPNNVAILPFTNQTDNPEASLAVRKTLFNHFAAKNYFSLHMREVDRRLQLAKLESSQTHDAKQIRLLADSLGVDGLIFGEVTHYGKLFVGVYAQVSVGVRMRFVSRSGRLVWQGEHVVRKHEGGISTTPVGMIIQAVASAMHIRDINLFRASDELGREIVAMIPEPERLANGLVQNIKRVVHDGSERHLKFGDTLTIAMEGTPGQKGYVRIKDLPLFTLAEGEPGFYGGEIVIPADVELDGVVVTGILEDAQGRRGEKIATTGYLFVDNTPPNPVADLLIEGRDGGVNIGWRTPETGDVDAFELLTAFSAQGPFVPLATTRKNHFEQRGLENFTKVYYQVIAKDRAGNRSQAATGEGRPLPDPRFATAQPVAQIIPPILNGLYVLTARGGPYLVQERVDLSPAGVLLVEPDSEIQLTAAGRFIVRGEFKIFGDRKRPVKVGGRDGMRFETFVELHGVKPVLIQGVEVRQGGVPFVISKGMAKIDGVVINGSLYNAFTIFGTARPLIQHSNIEGGHGGVALITGKARPRFANNRFNNNGPVHMQCTSPYLIKAADNLWLRPDISSEAALLTSNGCNFELD